MELPPKGRRALYLRQLQCELRCSVKLRQTEKSQSLEKAISHGAYGRGEVGRRHFAQDMDNAAPQRRHDLGRHAFAYPAGVFCQRHISAVVQPIFDAPMPLGQFQESAWRRLAPEGGW